MSSELERYQHAFIAVSYVLGRRGDELTVPLAGAGAELARRLCVGEKELRVKSLAGELARIVKDLEARRLA